MLVCDVQDVTGVIPADIPRIAGKPMPTPRRRVGTAFELSPKLLSPDAEVPVVWLMAGPLLLL